MIFNMFTCENWGFDILGGCTMAWAGFAILPILTLILRRQCADGVLSGTKFNFILAWIGCIAYIGVASLTGEVRWALLAGLAGLAIGGFGGAYIFETESDGGYEISS